MYLYLCAVAGGEIPTTLTRATKKIRVAWLPLSGKRQRETLILKRLAYANATPFSLCMVHGAAVCVCVRKLQFDPASFVRSDSLNSFNICKSTCMLHVFAWTKDDGKVMFRTSTIEWSSSFRCWTVLNLGPSEGTLCYSRTCEHFGCLWVLLIYHVARCGAHSYWSPQLELGDVTRNDFLSILDGCWTLSSRSALNRSVHGSVCILLHPKEAYSLFHWKSWKSERYFLHRTHGVLGFIYDFIARVGGPDFVPVGAATWPVRSISGKSCDEN